MKVKYKLLIYITLLIISISSIQAQTKYKAYGIGFYNLENLFDTEYDEKINDVDFTPNGALTWTPKKYQRKLENMAYVIDKLGKEYLPNGLAILGVAEIENRRVLEDLIKTDPIANKGYEIVHFDSPDRRGIDVALLYDPSQFMVTSSKNIPYNDPDTAFTTRDHLLVSGLLDGEPTHVIVNHWPSRRGGNASSPKREWGAANAKRIADSIYLTDNHANIIIMGDLNDNPDDKSCRVVLNAKKKKKEVEKGGLYNPMWDFYSHGIGSIGYKGQWHLFDQIIISENLLEPKNNKLKFWKAEIFNREFLISKAGKDKGYPHRTFRDDIFIDGYSDHFPTLIYLVKDISK